VGSADRSAIRKQEICGGRSTVVSSLNPSGFFALLVLVTRVQSISLDAIPPLSKSSKIVDTDPVKVSPCKYQAIIIAV
jgi:hypothetical protein